MSDMRIPRSLFNSPMLVLLMATTVGCASGHCRSKNTSDLSSKRNAEGEQLKETFKNSQTIPDSQKAKVYKSDGTLSCGQGRFVSLEIVARQLDGIEVLEKYSGSDGMVHTMSCGSPTGRVHIFVIRQTDLEKAKSLGFSVLNEN